MIWMITIQKELLVAKGNVQARQAAFDAALANIKAHHQTLFKIISAFEAKAPTVMKDIVGV